MKVTRIELPKTLTVSTALQFVGRIASVCTGIEVKDDAHAERIGKKNLTEAYGETPTRAWEFLAIDNQGSYMNFRGRINMGFTLEDCVAWYNDHLPTINSRKDFHIFHITAPRYVMAHIKTHQTLSSMMSSIRIGCNGETEYEFPEIEQELVSCADKDILRNNEGLFFYNLYTGKEFKNMLHNYYKRPEITKRPLSDFELVEMKICGYSEAWEWFINQRTCKGVQKETIEVANMIKELMK